jgi:hypothetical protein
MSTSHSLGLLLTCLLSLFAVSSATAATLSEGGYGYNTQESLKATCGGEGQDDCHSTAATFESSAVPNCPAGTTFNLFTWACHTCPVGFDFSFEGGWDPDSDRACSKELGGKADKVMGSQLIGDIVKAAETNTAPAEVHGPICAVGTFMDIIRDGECWSCPRGYERSWDHIDSDTACVKAAKNDYARIINHADGTGFFGTDCPAGSGQFWDGWDGKCHSCPTGYKRSIQHVGTSKACFKYVSSDTEPATLKKDDAVCEDGQSLDVLLEPERGGTCYSCPPTYIRTGESVKSWKACGTSANIAFENATLVSHVTCPPGQHFDFINWQHNRVKSKANKAAREKGLTLDRSNTNGGSCWSCPEMSAGTSGTAIYEPDACVAPDIRWEMPSWTSPGVYGRYANNAGVALVTELITQRSYLDAIIEEIWNEDQKRSSRNRLFPGLSMQVVKAELWNEIISRPENSGVLRLALKSILVRQAKGEGGLPAHSAKYLAAFEEAVTKYRTFLVAQSKAAFEIWDARAVERDVYKSNQTPEETLKKVFFVSIGMPWPPQSVPDFRGEAEELTLELQTTEAALKMAAVNENLSAAFRTDLLPVSYVKPRATAGNDVGNEARAYLEGEIQGNIEEQVQVALEKLVIRAAGSNGTKVASAMLSFAKFAEGPLLAIDVVLTIQDVWGEVIIDRATMGTQYENLLEMMSAPYSLRTELNSNASTGDFDLYVNVIMHNEPNDKFAKISPPSSWTAAACPKGEWAIKTKGGVSDAVCELGCPVPGSKKSGNGRCDYDKAPKYVGSSFVSSDYSNCPAGTDYKYDTANSVKGCMSCPTGYVKFGHWDDTRHKSTSTQGPYGECIVDEFQRSMAPVF